MAGIFLRIWRSVLINLFFLSRISSRISIKALYCTPYSPTKSEIVIETSSTNPGIFKSLNSDLTNEIKSCEFLRGFFKIKSLVQTENPISSNKIDIFLTYLPFKTGLIKDFCTSSSNAVKRTEFELVGNGNDTRSLIFSMGLSE